MWTNLKYIGKDVYGIFSDAREQPYTISVTVPIGIPIYIRYIRLLNSIHMGLIRFLLAVAVIVGHTLPIFGVKLVGGMTAVESFFILSGFYMSLVLHEKYNKGQKTYIHFLKNRFLRLYPMYWTVLLMVFITSLFWHFAHLDNHFIAYITYIPYMNPLTLLYFIFTNLFLFGQDMLFFMSLNTHTGLLFFTQQYTTTKIWLESFLFVPQAWTLGIELSFYVIAPFIFKRGWKFILTVFSLSLFIKCFLYVIGLTFEPWPYRFFPAEICFFLAGHYSYLLYRYIRLKHVPSKIPWILFATLVFSIVFYSQIPGIDLYTYNPFRILLYILLVVSIPFIFKLTKLSKVDNFVGRLSYPMYITHIFVIQIYNTYYLNFAMQNPLFSLTIIIVTVIASIMLLLLIDNPVQKLKYKPR